MIWREVGWFGVGLGLGLFLVFVVWPVVLRWRL